MKRSFCLLISVLIITAQACKPGAYFKTANDVSKMNAVVRMLDGTQKEGLITINFGREHAGERYEFVVLTTPQGEENIKAENIAYYKIGEDYYFPKIIDLYFDGTNRTLFVKRVTKENSRIQVYELFQQASETLDGQGSNNYCFISPPGLGRLETWNIFSKKLLPDFNIKMSALVEDCPELAKKILTKQKGYFMPQVMFGYAAKVETIKRIIDEYNNCR